MWPGTACAGRSSTLCCMVSNHSNCLQRDCQGCRLDYTSSQVSSAEAGHGAMQAHAHRSRHGGQAFAVPAVNAELEAAATRTERRWAGWQALAGSGDALFLLVVSSPDGIGLGLALAVLELAGLRGGILLIGITHIPAKQRKWHSLSLVAQPQQLLLSFDVGTASSHSTVAQPPGVSSVFRPSSFLGFCLASAGHATC